jgi:hexosaminidase
MIEKNFDPYVGDGQLYGGFYTQEQIKEIVAYATERHITVIPEIEMPGHSVAALAAYPELGCTLGPFEVFTKWGVTDDIYCPSEATFTFLENVLTEVIALFPGKYIHIGGDEAPKNAWKKSPLAQQVIKREGLKDEFELQSYFIRRIEKFLISKNRQLIGWDEILEGGLAPEATVMSWRGEAVGIEAAEEGHDVIMTPNSVAYFDHYQAGPEGEPLAIGGFTTLEDVYTYEPVPKELSAEKAHHVLGAQGNVWTEYMKTTEHVEYMVFPRMLALSETVWTNADKKDWSNFQKKMETQYKILDARNVNAFRPKEQNK